MTEMRKNKFKEKERQNILPGAIAASLLASLFVYLVLLNVEKNALSDYEKGKVIVAVENIARGEEFVPDNINKFFAEIQMDKNLIPQSAVTDFTVLGQMAAAVEIDQGSIITLSMLNNRDEMIRSMREPVVAGFKADDLFQVVSGTIRAGDRIHIYTVDEDINAAYLVWEDVLVQQVFDSSGNSIPAQDKESSAARINIILEEDSVEQFYSELAGGSLRVVKKMG